MGRLSLIFVPEGDTGERQSFSGIPHFFLSALQSVCDRKECRLLTMAFPECLEVEEIVHLIYPAAMDDARFSDGIQKKLHHPINSDFREAVRGMRNDEETERLIGSYWQIVSQVVEERIQRLADPGTPVLKFGPFVPFISEASKLNYYIDCIQTDFFFSQPYGPLSRNCVSERVIAFLRTEEIRLLSSAQRVFTFSVAAKAEIEKACLASRRQCTSVGAGANIRALDRSRRLESSDRSKEFKVLFIGKDFRRKGGEMVLKVASRFVGTNMTFALVTSGKHASLPQNCKVHQLLSYEECAELFCDSDLFLFPTQLEPFGIVICEAMAYGLPVVASRTGAVQEMLAHAPEGFLVEPDDVDGFFDAVTRASARDAEIAAYAAANRDLALNYYNWEKVAERVFDGIFGAEINQT